MRQLELSRRRLAGAAAAVAVLAAITVATPSARADEATGTPTPTASSVAAATSVADATSAGTTTATTTTTTTAPPTTTTSAPPTTTTPPPPTKTSTPAPVPAVISRTSSVLAIKDLQVRLKLLGRFPYAITGIYWSAVDRSVLAFQQAQNLPQSGVVDQRTWDRLRTLTASPIAIPRTAAAASVREAQLRLRAVGRWPYAITGVYWSALDRAVLVYQQTHNLPQSGLIDQRTWSRLVTDTYRPGTFDSYRYTAGLRPVMPSLASLDARCRTGRVMCVDKATRTLTWVVGGKPLMVMWARFGGPGRETREGTFYVSRMYEYVISNLYFTPMPYSMFFSGGQAVHYSSNFARLGYASSSHGCVNIADLAQVKSLYFQVRVGDKVVVRH